MGTVRSFFLHGLIVALAAAAILWGTTLVRQREQFDRGEAARGRGDFVAAVAGYESAMHLYVPGSPLAETAAGRLWAMGEEQERRGDAERALIAYRTIRSAFLAVRGLTVPGGGWIERCDDRIAALAGAERTLTGKQ